MIDFNIIFNLIKKSFSKSKSIFDDKYVNIVISSISTVRLNSLVFERDTRIDYETWLKNNYQYEFVPHPKHLVGPFATLFKSFNYIQMSRRKKLEHNITFRISNKPDLLNRYFNIENYLYSPSDVIINLNRKILHNFMRFIISKATELKKIVKDDIKDEHDKKSIISLSKYLLFGPPGIGKTAIINYLFSIYSNLLLKDKIIWIRVDLSKAPRNRHIPLKKLLDSKFLRIFSSEYLNKEKHPEFDINFVENALKPYLRDFLRTNYFLLSLDKIDSLLNQFFIIIQKLRGSNAKELDYIVDFLKGTSGEYIFNHSDDSYFSDLVDRLIYFLQKKYDYSYIFIFDGLDSATMDLIEYNIYDEWLTEIIKVTKNEELIYKALYIVTMRDYSLIRFLEENKDVFDEYSYTKKFRAINIDRVSFEDILYSKLILLKYRALKRDNIDLKYSDITNIKYNIVNLLFMCLNDINLKKVIKTNLHEKLSFIDKIFDNNYRQLMRFLRELFLTIFMIVPNNTFSLLLSDYNREDFCKLFEGQEWRINRLLIFGDQGYSAYKNRIQYFGEKAEFLEKNEFLPNVFNYFDNTPNHFPKVLIKLRIIKFLNNKILTKISNVILFLMKIYDDIDDAKCRKETREMIFSGVISPLVKYDYDLIESGQTKRDYPIKLMPLANFIINNMLIKSIYYEIIIDDTPIDIELINLLYPKIQPLNRFDIRFAYLEDYLMQKTMSIFNFILYLVKVESEEKSRIKDYLISEGFKEEEIESEYKNNYEIISEHIINAVFENIAKFFYGYISTYSDDIQDKIINKWINYFGIN